MKKKKRKKRPNLSVGHEAASAQYGGWNIPEGIKREFFMDRGRIRVRFSVSGDRRRPVDGVAGTPNDPATENDPTGGPEIPPKLHGGTETGKDFLRDGD